MIFWLVLWFGVRVPSLLSCVSWCWLSVLCLLPQPRCCPLGNWSGIFTFSHYDPECHILRSCVIISEWNYGGNSEFVLGQLVLL